MIKIVSISSLSHWSPHWLTLLDNDDYDDDDDGDDGSGCGLGVVDNNDAVTSMWWG